MNIRVFMEVKSWLYSKEELVALIHQLKVLFKHNIRYIILQNMSRKGLGCSLKFKLEIVIVGGHCKSVVFMQHVKSKSFHWLVEHPLEEMWIEDSKVVRSSDSVKDNIKHFHVHLFDSSLNIKFVLNMPVDMSSELSLCKTSIDEVHMTELILGNRKQVK